MREEAMSYFPYTLHYDAPPLEICLFQSGVLETHLGTSWPVTPNGISIALAILPTDRPTERTRKEYGTQPVKTYAYNKNAVNSAQQHAA